MLKVSSSVGVRRSCVPLSRGQPWTPAVAGGSGRLLALPHRKHPGRGPAWSRRRSCSWPSPGLSPRAVPYNMDEFVHYHALGCATAPLSRELPLDSRRLRHPRPAPSFRSAPRSRCAPTSTSAAFRRCPSTPSGSSSTTPSPPASRAPCSSSSRSLLARRGSSARGRRASSSRRSSTPSSSSTFLVDEGPVGLSARPPPRRPPRRCAASLAADGAGLVGRLGRPRRPRPLPGPLDEARLRLVAAGRRRFRARGGARSRGEGGDAAFARHRGAVVVRPWPRSLSRHCSCSRQPRPRRTALRRRVSARAGVSAEPGARYRPRPAGSCRTSWTARVWPRAT